MTELTIIGGGLAGCEAAWQAARRGIKVLLYEMRPAVQTPAHKTGLLAELVCSNSMGSNQRNRPAGLLQAELRQLNSFILQCAIETALPAGGSLAVDRDRFALLVTDRLGNSANVTIIRAEVTIIPDVPTIIATGPLTSSGMAAEIARLTGSEFLFFFDAIAPIVSLDSIDLNKAFWGSRYAFDKEDQGDYLNCPFAEEEYRSFIRELVAAERTPVRTFEEQVDKSVKINALPFFESCLPIEVLAARDPKALSFGPLRPVGLRDSHTDTRPYAVLQLRQDNLAKTLFNLVGFQTNLTYKEQERIFRLIPGLENADFIRYGQMHRNTYINSPRVLMPTNQYRQRDTLFFAGQIAGVEGYAGNIASGLVAGLNASRLLTGQPLLTFPRETMIGALHHYITHTDPNTFQPMKANFGLLPELEIIIRSKRDKKYALAKRSLRSLHAYCLENELECFT